MMGLALGYALHNYLSVDLISAAGSGTMNLVNSSTGAISAFILWRFAERKIMRMQWIALAILAQGLIFSQVCDL
jgi:hypothetical protein